MAAGEISLEINDGVALVTITRRTVRNALSVSTLEDFADTFDRVDNDLEHNPI